VIPVRTFEPALTRGGAPLLAALATWALSCAAAQEQPSPQPPAIAVSVRQPRAFGYVIGDRLEQRISLQIPAGLTLDPRGLPRAGRTGLWLELAPPHLTFEKVGDATRYRLTLDYQIINVPEQVRTIDLPAVDLAFSGRGGPLGASVDEWPITISPITPTYVLARAGLPQAQPDARPAIPESAPYNWLTLLWAAALAALGTGMTVRRRGISWLRRSARPFARAAHDIAKLARLPPDRSTYRRGLQRLHRAFDATAGHAVFGDRLTTLFDAHPELLRLRPEIEQFYASSQREFFGARADTPSLSAVLALAARCREVEATATRRARALESAAPAGRPHAV
jgi:mxaA protein